MGLLPVPASPHGNSFYTKVCSWAWLAHCKCAHTKLYIHDNTMAQILQEIVIKLNDFSWDTIQSPLESIFSKVNRVYNAALNWIRCLNIKFGVHLTLSFVLCWTYVFFALQERKMATEKQEMLRWKVKARRAGMLLWGRRSGTVQVRDTFT